MCFDAIASSNVEPRAYLQKQRRLARPLECFEPCVLLCRVLGSRALIPLSLHNRLCTSLSSMGLKSHSSRSFCLCLCLLASEFGKMLLGFLLGSEARPLSLLSGEPVPFISIFLLLLFPFFLTR